MYLLEMSYDLSTIPTDVIEKELLRRKKEKEDDDFFNDLINELSEQKNIPQANKDPLHQQPQKKIIIPSYISKPKPSYILAIEEQFKFLAYNPGGIIAWNDIKKEYQRRKKTTRGINKLRDLLNEYGLKYDLKPLTFRDIKIKN